MIAFIPRGIESKGSEHAVKEAKKLGKKVVIVN
jgi:hypothetical protein